MVAGCGECCDETLLVNISSVRQEPNRMTTCCDRVFSILDLFCSDSVLCVLK
jgi:hypothetical protein